MLRFTIQGEPASKANQRKLVTLKGKPALIKSPKALDYVQSALLQIPMAARQRLEGPIEVHMRIFYRTEKPDLDESVILDVLQDQWARVNGQRILIQSGVYRNDRQVRRKVIEHGIDKQRPRAEISIQSLNREGEPNDG
jgi:Holliday junction resolvase RusA-like endonuclease